MCLSPFRDRVCALHIKVFSANERDACLGTTPNSNTRLATLVVVSACENTRLGHIIPRYLCQHLLV